VGRVYFIDQIVFSLQVYIACYAVDCDNVLRKRPIRITRYVSSTKQ